MSTIKLNPANPPMIKDDKFKKLCKSVAEFPEMMELRPIIIDENNVILGGNMRYQALKAAGIKDIPDSWVKRADELTEDQKREFIAKDNVSFGEWDFDILANEWDADLLTEWGVDLLDTTGEELEAKEDNYQIPDEIKTDIVRGDLIEIGDHRLLCGDSTQTDTFTKLFNGKQADLIVTDPPYNVDYTGGTDKKLKIANDNMSDGDFYQFLYDFHTAIGAFLKCGGGVYVWHADIEGLNFRRAFIESGLSLKQCLIWVKNSMVMGRQDYQWKHEPCLYGWKPGAAHGWYSDRKQTTILEFDRPSRSAEHPTMKPVTLFAYQIGNSSKQGDIVADGFGGSGTTMVACQQMSRKAYLVEFDPKYCQVIVDRMRKLDPTLEIKRNGEVWPANG